MKDYKLLSGNGNIGFYNSCEIIEIFMYSKKDKLIFNLFSIIVFEEKLFTTDDKKFLGDRIALNKDCSIGIKKYNLSLKEAEIKYSKLKDENLWGDASGQNSNIPILKYLPKQFVSSNDGVRLNKILKNNFHNGSYILEFFDESKENFSSLLDINKVENYNKICSKINDRIPIDLSVARDRIGNIIFQFPINIIETNSKALSSWDGVEMNFTWHDKLNEIPECIIQLESTLDKNSMGSVLEDYNKTSIQEVKIGNMDGINQIQLWRKNPSLILNTFSGTFIREFSFNMGIINTEPRIFEIDGQLYKVEVSSKNYFGTENEKITYTTFIHGNLYDAEKKQLENSLSFKQYKNETQNSIQDIQKLISRYDENGVYIWDPFLTPTDILKTLFFSKTSNVPLRAIGSINDNVRNVYDKKGISAAHIIDEYKSIYENPNSNNFALNLEFRLQHSNFGWSFHDRFLIFPSAKFKRAKVYSLGTSINSYGKSHHILQEVSHPQPILDAFNELWDNLNHPECLVWKS